MTDPGTEPPLTSVPGADPHPTDAVANPVIGSWQRCLGLLQVCGFVLLIAGLAAIMAMSMRSEDADAWVAHTLETRRATGMLFSVIQDAEANVRAYLLVNDPTFIERYDAAHNSVPAAQLRLRTLTLDNPEQTARLDALAPLIQQRLEVLAAALAAARARDGDKPGLSQQVRPREGAALMADIRARLAAFDQSEAELLGKRETVASQARRHVLLGGSGALSLALLLGGLTTLLSRRQTNALRDANRQLAAAVSARADALRASEARFHQVFRDSPIGLTIATADTRRIIAANPAFCRMLGYTEAELLGRTARDLAHPDDCDIVVPVAIDRRVKWRPIDKRYITKSGSPMAARTGVVLLELPSEREPLILGTTEDVTYEKAIEAALRDSEMRMRLAVEVTGLGVYEQDAKRRITCFDERAASFTADTIPAKITLSIDGPELAAWHKLIHPDDVAARTAAETSLLDGSTDMATSEFRVRLGDGNWAWISAVGTVAERDPATNQVLRVMTVLQDITLRKETELELRHAQRMEAVGQLTGGVAHDFNNLLGAILGHTEFLLDLLSEQSEERQLATEILDCTLNGAALTQRLLAFARRQPLQPAVIDLNEYVPVHVSLLQRTLGETVTVNVTLAPGLWQTLVDPSQIVDVLLNLAINARDAMPHGGKLTIKTANAVLDSEYCARHREAIPGEFVVLSVIDTGTGMSPEVLARAMEPFFTTKPMGKGSGLGLSTIYGFARQSGGFLSIDSQLGEGTTVHLYLPRTFAEKGTATVHKARIPPLPRGNEAILVVDDNDSMRATAARNLAALGYRVRLAADGPSALEILRGEERFDLLFTDVVMPNGLSGYQLADAARELRPSLPVLFTTGFAAEDDGETAVMDPDALRKPYRRRELADRVRAALG